MTLCLCKCAAIITPHTHTRTSLPCSQPASSLPLSPSTERSALEAGVLRVLHQGGERRDAEEDDGGGAAAGSAVATIARELLQEAAEHVGALLAESLEGEASAGEPPLGEVMGRRGRTHKSTDVTRLVPSRRREG